MLLKQLSLASALGCAAVAASAFVSMPAHAACLTTTGGTAPNIDNNCVTYNNVSLPTVATVHFQDTKLAANGNWQLVGNDITFSNLSNWQYSQDGATFTSFTPTVTIISGFARSEIFTNLVPIGNPFFLRVTLSPTATLNAYTDFSLFSNSNGAVDGDGILRSNATNGFTAMTRSFQRQSDPPVPPVPGPLPLLGAAAAFGHSRRIRKAIRAAR